MPGAKCCGRLHIFVQVINTQGMTSSAAIYKPGYQQGSLKQHNKLCIIISN